MVPDRLCAATAVSAKLSVVVWFSLTCTPETVFERYPNACPVTSYVPIGTARS